MAGQLEIVFVDPVRVVTRGHAGDLLERRFYTCSRCCALVLDDYMEGHERWHQRSRTTKQ
jgi:hypothetical protein